MPSPDLELRPGHVPDVTHLILGAKRKRGFARTPFKMGSKFGSKLGSKLSSKMRQREFSFLGKKPQLALMDGAATPMSQPASVSSGSVLSTTGTKKPRSRGPKLITTGAPVQATSGNPVQVIDLIEEDDESNLGMSNKYTEGPESNAQMATADVLLRNLMSRGGMSRGGVPTPARAAVTASVVDHKQAHP